MSAWVGVGAAVLAVAMRVAAQPTVMVRAESRLELDVRRAQDGLVVSGALRDDLGAPLGGEDVTLELSHADASMHERGSHVLTRVVTAAADGSFSTHFQVDLGDYAVDAAYEGAAEHRGTRATRFFDLDRAHLTLRLALEGGARVDLAVPEHVLTVTASSEAGGAGLDMIVTDESGGTELGRGTTDAEGTLHVPLASAALGPPAAGRVVVRTRGDATRAEAQSELPIVRFRATRTTLTLSRTTLGPDDVVEARGTLDDGVAPLEREAISVAVADDVLATVLTDDRGAYVARIDAAALGEREGELAVRARFDGSAPWIPGSESPPVTLVVRRPLPIDWLWAAVPIVLAALVVRWSLRRDPGARAVVSRRAEGAPGVAMGARRSIVAQRLEVSGVVRDAITSEPIHGARVRAGGQQTTTDVHGAFSLVGTREAAFLAIAHPEYLDFETPLALPHRGEHEGMHVRIAGRRAVSFAALRHVASELAPDGEVALALTQREIFEVLRARGASPPQLPALISRVEVACYADAPPTDEEIVQIRQSAEGIARATPRHASMGTTATRR